MTYKVILIPFSGSGADLPALHIALDLSRRFSAWVSVLYHQNPPEHTVGLPSFPMPAGYPDAIETDFLTKAQQREEHARASFATLAHELGVPVSAAGETLCAGALFAVEEGEIQPAFKARTLAADLIVLPLTPETRTDRELREVALFQSGLPVMVVPPCTEKPAPFQKVMIAWNGSMEAARAVRLALPILLSAQVQVFTAEEDKLECDGEQLANYLRRHGVEVAGVRSSPVKGDVTSTLLAAAAGFGAELLVMGAFCRETRLREALLGSFTHEILSRSPLPVLLAS